MEDRTAAPPRDARRRPTSRRRRRGPLRGSPSQRWCRTLGFGRAPPAPPPAAVHYRTNRSEAQPDAPQSTRSDSPCSGRRLTSSEPTSKKATAALENNLSVIGWIGRGDAPIQTTATQGCLDDAPMVRGLNPPPCHRRVRTMDVIAIENGRHRLHSADLGQLQID